MYRYLECHVEKSTQGAEGLAVSATEMKCKATCTNLEISMVFVSLVWRSTNLRLVALMKKVIPVLEISGETHLKSREREV